MKKELLMRKVTVIQDEENPIAVDVMASAIVEIGSAMKRISSSKLSRKALVVLIQHDVKLGIGTIEAVLDSLDSLESTYLKPEKKP